ncbi:MAG: hypothetical protein U0640_05615 [Phycisphaerales bacterium]
MGTVAANSVVCPRCGYDLRGQVDTWRVPLATQADVVRFESGEVLESEVGAKCPVEGTCSECGLGFEWKYVFRPELAGPGWFVETRRVGRVRAWFATVRRVLLLRPFFRRDIGMKIETPFHLRRMLWYLAIFMILVPCVGFVFQQAWRAAYMWFAMGKPLGAASYVVFANSPTDIVRAIAELEFFGGQNWFCVGFVCSLGFALMMSVLPDTRANAKVRTAHVGRAMVYSITWLCVPLLLGIVTATLDGMYSAMSTQAAPSPTAIGFMDGIGEVVDFLQSQYTRFLLVGATVIWCYTYWWCVLRMWWRMREALVAYVACAVPVAIMVIVAMVYTFPRYWLWTWLQF